MKRYVVMAIVALALVAAILLGAMLLKKDDAADAPDCLNGFLKGWSINYIDNMLSSCAPSWKAQQSNPELRIFHLMANRTANAWFIGKPEQDGDALVYPVDVQLRHNNILQEGWQRFSLRVVTENGRQYVIPEGIAAGEPVKAPKNYVTK